MGGSRQPTTLPGVRNEAPRCRVRSLASTFHPCHETRETRNGKRETEDGLTPTCPVSGFPFPVTTCASPASEAYSDSEPEGELNQLPVILAIIRPSGAA